MSFKETEQVTAAFRKALIQKPDVQGNNVVFPAALFDAFGKAVAAGHSVLPEEARAVFQGDAGRFKNVAAHFKTSFAVELAQAAAGADVRIGKNDTVKFGDLTHAYLYLKNIVRAQNNI